MSPRMWLLVLLAGGITCKPVLAQSLPAKDPQALALATQALSGFIGTTPLQDIVLQGRIAYAAGSDLQTGTATLQARGTGQSRIDLNLDGGTRADVRDDSGGIPQGAWTGPDGVWQPIALHNNWTDAAWFFPHFSLFSAASDADVALAYLGWDTLDGVEVERLRLSRIVSGQQPSVTETIKELSTLDIYLAANSLVPLAVKFNVHPEDDAGVDVPVEIRYGDYRAVSGVRVPHRIQRYMQGSLYLDLFVDGVALNSGIPESRFTLP